MKNVRWLVLEATDHYSERLSLMCRARNGARAVQAAPRLQARWDQVRDPRNHRRSTKGGQLSHTHTAGDGSRIVLRSTLSVSKPHTLVRKTTSACMYHESLLLTISNLPPFVVVLYTL